VASKSLVKWLKMLWENWKASVWSVVCGRSLSFCLVSSVLFPTAGEFAFLL
jgi:hypothetical protein